LNVQSIPFYFIFSFQYYFLFFFLKKIKLRLIKLCLNDNQIDELSPKIGQLNNLEFLSLSENFLTQLCPEILTLSHLKGEI